MMLTRTPGPQLAPFVELLWATDEDVVRTSAAKLSTLSTRELVLPTGKAHLALRLSASPLRVFAHVDEGAASAISAAVIGGPRSGPYVRETAEQVPTVGALLRPSLASLLIGAPLHELSEQHTPLEALWGARVESMRDELANVSSLAQRLARFERRLCERVPRIRGIHPAIAAGLTELQRGSDVADAVAASGYSHRRFGALFRTTVGLSPKLFARVQRFGRAVAAAHEGSSWAAIAAGAGYADQAHFARDFREFAGVTPGRYRLLAPAWPHHVPLPHTGGARE